MSAIRKAVTREELAYHCRRRTKGTVVTESLIEALLLELVSATDSLGVPVLSDQMAKIWEEEKKHVACIQDPEGIPLYTITGYIKKGGVDLPVLCCARGTSLESFHLHLARYMYLFEYLVDFCVLAGIFLLRFIPGSSASDVHYQGFLLEGLAR